MALRTRRLTAGGHRLAALSAIALVLLGTFGGLLAHDTIRDRDRATGRDRIAADLARFELSVANLVAEVGQAAARVTDPEVPLQPAVRRLLDRHLVDAVVVVDAGAGEVATMLPGRHHIRPFGEGTDLDEIDGLAPAVEAAISDGLADVVAPLALDGGPAIAVVAPLVPPGTGTDVVARRAAVHRVLVGVVPVDHLRRPADHLELWPGADVTITTSTGRIGEPAGSGDGGDTIDAGSDVWTISVTGLDSPRRLIGWYTAALGLLAAGITYLALRRQHHRQRRAEQESATHARHLELIAETGAALQQSLDLADQLPVFSLRLADEFGLHSVSIEVADDAGRLTEAFRYGAPWPGEVLAGIDLRRGSVAVGRLSVGAREPLDDLTMQSVHALADLLTVSVSNAHLLLREQQAVARLSELDALKNAFLGTVSHELRTATTAVQGFGELLTEHWATLPEDRRRELAERIRRQAGSLRHLVDDLLDYARLEHQSLRVIPRQLSLTDLVRQLTESMSPLVADHDVRLATDGEVDAWVDPIAVERILANLLSNAGKYAPPGTVVTVGVENRDGRARLSVADQGPGIPTAERRRVFARFYRLSNDATIRTRGAGIGLAILHDFAEYSHAEVEITDAEGGGTLITVDFPMAPLDSPAMAPS